MNTMTTAQNGIIEKLALAGDVSGLTTDQKIIYYKSLCERVGLDPATQPFKLLRLSGKEVFYCDRSGAQQLNRLHGVSHEIRSRETVAGCYVVTAKAFNSKTATESIGAVPIEGLKGEPLCNAMMKAETKAKRRATLDLVGLGMLDETEIASIPGATPAELPLKTPQDAPDHVQTRPDHQKRVQPAIAAQGEPDKAMFLEILSKKLTPEQRTWLEGMLRDFLDKDGHPVSWLMPTETLTDLDVEKLANIVNRFDRWMVKLDEFMRLNEHQELQPKAVTSAPDTEPVQNGNVAEGVLEHISTKTGTSRKGPWTRWGFKIDGQWYNTFDSKLAAIAESLLESRVRVTFEEGPKGRDVVDIESA